MRSLLYYDYLRRRIRIKSPDNMTYERFRVICAQAMEYSKRRRSPAFLRAFVRSQACSCTVSPSGQPLQLTEAQARMARIVDAEFQLLLLDHPLP